MSNQRIDIDRDSLLASLGRILGLVERRTTILALSHVLAHLDNGILSLTASNMEMTATDHVAVKSGADQKLTLPAHLLAEVVAKLPEKSIITLDYNIESSKTRLTCGASRFILAGVNPDEVPTLPKEDLPVAFSLSQKDLTHLIKATGFAMSREETRRYLNGIYLEVFEGKYLRAVATDGHRLALAQVEAPKEAKDMPSIIIPRRAVDILSRIVDDKKDQVDIALSQNRIVLRFNGLEFITRLVDGSFPDYRQVIPKPGPTKMTIIAEDFRQAVDLVSTVSSDKSRHVKLSLKDKLLTLQTTTPEGIEGQKSIDNDFSGEPIEIGFNARYLSDIVSQLGNSQVYFYFSDESTPMIVRPVEDDGSLYILMPMRI